MSSIKFIKPTNDEMIYNPSPSIDTYYQICQYKNKPSNLYETRKIIFNEKGKILKTYERSYNKTLIKKFIKDAKINKYKVYPATSIDSVMPPNTSDMTHARSELLNRKSIDYNWFDENIEGAPI